MVILNCSRLVPPMDVAAGLANFHVASIAYGCRDVGETVFMVFAILVVCGCFVAAAIQVYSTALAAGRLKQPKRKKVRKD
jgi:hypothetical protein